MKISILKILVYIIMLFLIYLTLSNMVFRGIPTQKVTYLDNIPEPVQESYSEKITQKFNKDLCTINFVAKYEISARVVVTQDYYATDGLSNVSPYDFGLVWGILSTNKYDDVLTYYSTRGRFLHFGVRGNYPTLGTVERCSSNNHLIPANKTIKKYLSKIRKNDYIKLNGYLCYVNAPGYETWESSLSRTDTGDGACEIMYVTDVKLLKK